MANCEAPRPAKAGAQAGERRASRSRGRLSARGRLVSGDRGQNRRTLRRPRRADTRAARARTSAKISALPRPPASLPGPFGPAPPPRHSHNSTARRFSAGRADCASGHTDLTSHVESDTWKHRIRYTAPLRRLQRRTTSPRKQRVGRANFRR